MIRRKQFEDDADSPDRWLVSYADFITLLFAFFVVMYAVSSVNLNKYQALSSSINTAFSNETTTKNKSTETKPANVPITVKQTQSKNNVTKEQNNTPRVNPTEIKPTDVKPEAAVATAQLNAKQIEQLQLEREAMKTLGTTLSANLSPLIGQGKVRITQNNRGLRIDINDSVLFNSGSAELEQSAKPVLNEIATLLLTNNHAIQVEGHTDNTPIHNPVFFSNWELSAVRASSVVRMFNSLGIIDTRLSALGFGSSQPVSENTTEEGRSKNRHVSLVILYDSLNATNEDGAEITPHD